MSATREPDAGPVEWTDVVVLRLDPDDLLRFKDDRAIPVLEREPMKVVRRPGADSPGAVLVGRHGATRHVAERRSRTRRLARPSASRNRSSENGLRT